MKCFRILLDSERGIYKVIEGFLFSRCENRPLGLLLCGSDGPLFKANNDLITVFLPEGFTFEENTLHNAGPCFIPQPNTAELAGSMVNDPCGYTNGQKSGKHQLVLYPLSEEDKNRWVMIQYITTEDLRARCACTLGEWNELETHLANGRGHYKAYGYLSDDRKSSILCANVALFSDCIEFDEFCFNISVDQDGKPVVAVKVEHSDSQ